jgi:hypothetical protein
MKPSCVSEVRIVKYGGNGAFPFISQARSADPQLLDASP